MLSVKISQFLSDSINEIGFVNFLKVALTGSLAFHNLHPRQTERDTNLSLDANKRKRICFVGLNANSADRDARMRIPISDDKTNRSRSARMCSSTFIQSLSASARSPSPPWTQTLPRAFFMRRVKIRTWTANRTQSKIRLSERNHWKCFLSWCSARPSKPLGRTSNVRPVGSIPIHFRHF